MTKVKLRSWNTVMTTGIGMPASIFCVRRVELLAEFHDVDALLTERRPDRRRRIGLASRHLQLDVGLDLLSHAYPFFVGGAVRPWQASRTRLWSSP